jgi:hypothetical protein
MAGAGATISDAGDRVPSAEDDYTNETVSFLQSLKETGYVERQNAVI